MASSLVITAKGGAYWEVYADGVKVSQHVQEREAIQRCAAILYRKPKADVDYRHNAICKVTLALDQPPAPPDSISLQPSGSITVTGDGQVIENKLITGNINIQANGVTVRNCHVKFPGRNGIFAINAKDVTIQDVKLENTAAATGQNPNPTEDICIHLNNVSGTAKIDRATMIGASGIYAVISPGFLNFSFLEGHNLRSPITPLRGQLVQLNQCSGGALITDFSCENDPKNSRPEDVLNVFTCTGPQIAFKRGLLDGCNSPSGCMAMVEGTSNVLFEDVDAINFGNGAFAVYNYSGKGASGVIYRRCRARDQIMTDQGLGRPKSAQSAGPIVYISSPGTSGTRIEQNIRFNVNENNLIWDKANCAVMESVVQDFTPRAPVRNQFAWG